MLMYPPKSERNKIFEVKMFEPERGRWETCPPIANWIFTDFTTIDGVGSINSREPPSIGFGRRVGIDRHEAAELGGAKSARRVF